MRARVALLNLGCRVNRVECDLMANRLERAGCELTDAEDADVVIVNTCAVTGEAQTKTRKAVRRAARLPQAPVVIATGCVASLFADELRQLGDAVLVEPNKAAVPEVALRELGLGDAQVGDAGILAVSPTPTGRTRPGIKVQDGCDNRCSFCIVWKARGPSRSVASEQVLDAVREACARNAREVVLTGINLGSYRAPAGDALGEGANLARLLTHILEQTGIERVRLSSIEPPDVTDELLEVMAGSGGRVAPFLHICLQSGCDATLARMRRVYDTALYQARVEAARSRMPRIALGCDVIVGFPGETDEEFAESIEFCRRMGFARMHVFRYSRRPGTPAATAHGQVDAPVSAARAQAMRQLARQMRERNMEALVGAKERVLVQSPGRAVSEGLFDVAVDPALQVGELALVRYAGVRDGYLLAAGA